MLKKFLPSEYVKSVLHIDPKHLKERGVQAIITDLDNTLVSWDRPDATEEIIDWLAKVKEQQIKVIIVSNNNGNRVKLFSEPLNIPYISKAKKPLSRAFKQATSILNVKKEHTVIIGDQLMTDILGGNRAGYHTILVVPVAKSDGFFTKFNRMMERRIMKSFKKQGLLEWEDEK